MRRMVAVVVLVVSLAVCLPATAAETAAPSLWELWSGWWSQAFGELFSRGAPAAPSGSGKVTSADGVAEEPPPDDGGNGATPQVLVDPGSDLDTNGCEGYPEFDPNG